MKDKCALQRPAEEAVLVGNVPRASSSAVCGSVLVQEGMCSELEETKQRLLCCIKKHSLKVRTPHTVLYHFLCLTCAIYLICFELPTIGSSAVLNDDLQAGGA